MKLKDRLLDAIYPRNLYCSCCGDLIEGTRIHGICDSCAEKILWLSDNPFKASMEDFAFDDLISCCVYGHHARKLITSFKLSGKTYLAEGISRLMAERAADGRDYDLLVPVPATKNKTRARGFSHTELLAGRIAGLLDIQAAPEALVKIRDTASMRLSDEETRRTALIGAFEVPPDARDLISGKSILLADDVVTTGSTADECARTLKNAGAVSVTVLCFASSFRAFDSFRESL